MLCRTGPVIVFPNWRLKVIKLIQYLIDNKLVANLLVLLIFVLGLGSFMKLNREAYPQASLDMVSIKTIYPGASPDELESLVSIPIEKKLREVDGLDKVRSYNIDNVSVVVAYIDEHASSKKQIVQDVKDAVDMVEGLPSQANKPLVEEVKVDKTEVISVAMSAAGDGVPFEKVWRAADELEDLLYDFDGVAEVEGFGFLDRQYLVEVDPFMLERYRVGMNTIINVLANRNVDLPGGPLRVGDEEYVLRTKGQFRDIREVRDTVMMANDYGYTARISDLALVTDTFEEPSVYERFQGEPAIIFKIWKKHSADEIELAGRIKQGIKEFQARHEGSVAVVLFNDQSEKTLNNINSVITNAVTGFILLALILFVLLGWRISTLMTALIPLVFLIAFIGMGLLDVTINVVSLFGLVMVLGMIVDFGIVVAENTSRYLEMGVEKREAVVSGIREVLAPITVTFLCIAAAFVPLLLITGLMGKFIKFIPMVIMICLAASWFVAIFLLPSYLNSFLTIKKKPVSASPDAARDELFSRGGFGAVQRKYMALLRFSLKHRYIVLGVILLLLASSFALVPVLGFVFTPGGGSEEIQIRGYMPTQTNLAANLREIKTIERLLFDLLPKDELESVYARVGVDVADGAHDPKPGEGTHKATLYVYLTPEKDRNRTADEIAAAIREAISAVQKKGALSGAMITKVEVQENGPPIGKPVNVEIRGKEFDTMMKIAREYMEYLKTAEGVYDISMDFEAGKTEYRFRANEKMAKRSGVSVNDIAQAILASFQGIDATSVREGDDDIALRVRFRDAARRTMSTLDKVKVANNAGGLIDLGMVTSVDRQAGISQINRLNSRRLIQVQAQLDTGKTNTTKVTRRLEKHFHDISRRYPGYAVAYGGEQEETNKSMAELGDLFMVALLVIFIVLAVFFRSLSTPLVVMSAIPFSLVGVIFALFVHGEPLCFMTMLAMFSLAGVLVSNTVTLVEFINNRRDMGSDLVTSIAEGTMLRLRPVILTTGTTVLGLLPSIYGIGDKDYMVAPLALSFGYGLIFATIITLVLVPCLYHIAEDMKGRMAKFMGWFGVSMDGRIYRGK